MLASDGKMRCLPSWEKSAGSVGQFADAACTVPAALVTANCVPTYLIAYTPSPCTGGLASYIYSVHASVVVSTATTYYYRSGSTCAQTTVTPGYSLVTAAETIDPSNFVAATYVTE